jgi:hypothetical protein
METKDVKELIKLGAIQGAIQKTMEIAESLSDDFHSRAIVLNTRLLLYQKNKTDGLIPPNDESILNIIRFDLLAFLNEIDDFGEKKTEIIHSLNDTLLDNSFPFVERMALRDFIKTSIEGKSSKMIFVKGESKSGLTYIEKYLNYLSQKNELYRVVNFHVPSLDGPEPFKGVQFAKFLSLDLGFDANLNEAESDQFKFTKFTTKLREKLANQPSKQTVIFFLHDFHRLNPMPDDIKKFIQNLAFSIQSNFPKTIFIISGFQQEQLPSWNDDFQFNDSIFSVYEMEKITKDGFKQCLQAIYTNFKPKIVKMNGGTDLTADEYIDGMLDLISPVGKPFNLAEASFEIKKHLFNLKKL